MWIIYHPLLLRFHGETVRDGKLRSMKHAGGCHCGKVRYETDVDLGNVIECNCSHCSRKGLTLSFVPASQFSLTSGEDNLSEYRFNTKKIQHLFCKDCGVQSFSRGKTKEGADTVAVNVRCLDEVSLEELEPNKFDGKNY